MTSDSTTVVTVTDTGSADFYDNPSYGTGTTTTYTLSSGEAVIYVRDFVAETITINAIDDGNNPGTSAVITVYPAVVATYTFAIGTSQVAGVGFSGTVSGFDQYDNLADNDSTTVFTLVDDGSADFYDNPSYGTGTTTTYTLSAGEATIYVRDFVAETIILNAIDANAAPGTSASIGIVPNTVGYYTFTIGTSQVAGTGFAGTVQGFDAYDNFAVNDSTTVFTLVDDGSADFYTSSSYGTGTTETYTLTSGEVTVYVRDFAAETIVLNAIDANAAPGTSASIAIYAEAVNYYTVTAPTPQVAGTGFEGTVMGYDVYNNLVANDSATVLTLTDTGSADFYATASYGIGTTETYTLASGTATIYVRDLVAETIQITAESDNGSIGTSADIVINPEVVNYYTVSATTPQTAGVGFEGTVEGFDTYDNLVVNDSATVMTLTDTGSASFYTSDSYGTGTTETYTLASGVATIYVRDLVAETIQITAESDNGSIGTSADIVINPSAITYYTVTVPTPQTAGEGFEGTVQAYDVNNNLVITDSSTVMTLTDTGFAGELRHRHDRDLYALRR